MTVKKLKFMEVLRFPIDTKVGRDRDKNESGLGTQSKGNPAK